MSPWDHQRYAPVKPRRVDDGIASRSRRGQIGDTWWSKRFLGSLEAVMASGRASRGRRYARQGHVIGIDLHPGVIEAHVQGTRSDPYLVRLVMPVVPDEAWERIGSALAARAGYAARLLAGELPPEVEEVFALEGESLLPAPGSRLTTSCSCPDWENPCKHIAAVCYLVAEDFDRDPFGVLAWRGRDRKWLLGRLRELRASSHSSGSAAQEAGSSGPVEASAPEPSGRYGAIEGVPPLKECVGNFWKAGTGLDSVRVRPEPSPVPAAVLRYLPEGLLEIRGRDISEMLEPAYAAIVEAARRRALGGGSPSKRARGT